MSARQPRLLSAPAWLFLLFCAGAASVLAAASLLTVPPPGIARAGGGKFALGDLAEATAVPAPASKPEAAAVPAKAEPAVQARREPTAEPKPKTKAEPAPAPVQVEKKGAPESPGGAAPAPGPIAQAAPATTTSPATSSSASAPSTPAVPLKPVAPDASLQSGTSSASSAAAGEVRYGTRASGSITVAGLSVPLPPGEWRVAADIPAASRRDLALVRMSGEVATGAMIVSYAWAAGGLGYPRGSNCTRSGVRGMTEKNDDFGEQACWVTAVVASKALLQYQTTTAVGRALRGEFETQGMKINSEVLVNTSVLLANTQRRLFVLAFDNPEAAGIEPKPLQKPDDSDWHSKNLGQHPDKVKYVREQLQWASQAYEQLKRGFAAATN